MATIIIRGISCGMPVHMDFPQFENTQILRKYDEKGKYNVECQFT